MADLRWQLNYKDKQYEFDADRDLTVGNLRAIKKLYGPDLGRYQLFVLALGQGDPDAWASALWMALKAANVKPLPAPDMLDFSVGPMMEAIGEAEQAAEEALDTSEEGPTEPAVEPDVPTPV